MFQEDHFAPVEDRAVAGPLVVDLRDVVDLQDAGERRLALVGGKGLNLGRLIKAGLPVPQGFCVTTAAYEAACRRPPIPARVRDMSTASAHSPADLQRAAAALRDAILAARIPHSVESAVRGAYAALGAAAVAVRSSATVEDLPTASFAGQQETYLNVIGGDAVLDAVRRCWASLWTDRAVSYRASLGLEHGEMSPGVTAKMSPGVTAKMSPGVTAVSLAVVVQRMVASRVSGVLFTANPLTGCRREMVIDASVGLGEAVVSGAVNPDHFMVDTESGEIRECRLGDKRVRIHAVPGGGTEKVVTSAPDTQPCLDTAQIGSLRALGRNAQRLFSAPQDIEWAIDGPGDAWLTQSRCITTLFPLPEGAPDDPEDIRVYYSVNASQGMEQPFTPLGASLFRLLVSSVAAFLGYPPRDAISGPSFVNDASGWLYLDVTKALRSAMGRTILTGMTSTAEARAGAVISMLAEDPRFSTLSTSRLPFARAGLSFLLRAHVPWLLIRSLVDPGSGRGKIDALRKRFERIAAATEAADAADPAGAAVDAGKRVQVVLRLFSSRTIGRLLGIMPSTAVPGMMMVALARRLLGSLASADDLEAVQRGLPNNPTTEMDLALWRFASEIPAARRESFLSGRDSLRLEPFLREYGHRCAAELDGGLARWSEDPAPLYSMIANYYRSIDAPRSPETIFRASAAAAEQRAEELVRRARTRGRLRAALVRFCLSRARGLLGYREVPRSAIGLLLDFARRVLLPVGRGLVETGRLDAVDDLSFLRLAEIQDAPDGSDLRAVVRARREEHEREMRRRHAPAVLLSDGTEPQEERLDPGAPGTLRGMAASSGTVTGIARVLLSAADARLEPGEILVAPSTDPGWTPLFLTAAALVMETGGPMAHGAIVAREYGIPAVVAVPGATTLIRSGARVTVDGTNGTVVIVDETPEDRIP